MKHIRLHCALAALIGMTLNAVPSAAHATGADDSAHVSCSHGGELESIGARAASAAPQALDPAILSPNADFPYLTVTIGKVANYSPSQKAKLDRAVALMEKAINSEALKEKILAHTYQGKPQFADNQGRTNEEIYESIRRAMELTFGQFEFTAEFNHKLYRKRFSKVVGWTDIGQPWIHTNTKYFNPYSDADVAGHLAHEWLHLLGYLHDSTFAGSVPYDVGDMVAEIAAQL